MGNTSLSFLFFCTFTTAVLWPLMTVSAIFLRHVNQCFGLFDELLNSSCQALPGFRNHKYFNDQHINTPNTKVVGQRDDHFIINELEPKPVFHRFTTLAGQQQQRVKTQKILLYTNSKTPMCLHIKQQISMYVFFLFVILFCSFSSLVKVFLQHY